MVEATDAGVRLDATMLDKLHPTPGAENDPLLISWSRAITIAIDADGTVRLVTAFDTKLDTAGRIVRHPSLEHADGVTIAIPVRPGPPK
ncbi:MAG: hypothetical protein AAFN41_12520 [Planctomycetota bacterium]